DVGVEAEGHQREALQTTATEEVQQAEQRVAREQVVERQRVGPGDGDRGEDPEGRQQTEGEKQLPPQLRDPDRLTERLEEVHSLSAVSASLSCGASCSVSEAATLSWGAGLRLLPRSPRACAGLASEVAPAPLERFLPSDFGAGSAGVAGRLSSSARASTAAARRFARLPTGAACSAAGCAAGRSPD